MRLPWRVGVVVIATAWGSPLLAQTTRLNSDPRPVTVRFTRDSVSEVFKLQNSTVIVRAERGTNLPTTGRYLVFNNEHPVAAAIDEELTLGGPSLAFVSEGEPAVAILSTYTGGTGIAAYYLKVLVFSKGEVAAFTLNSANIGVIPSNVVLTWSRPTPGQFQAEFWGGLKIRLADTALEVTPGQ